MYSLQDAYENGFITKDMLLYPMTQMNVSDFVKPADSVSLAKLSGQIFEIVKTEPSSYEEQKGFKITTKISYEIDGKKWNKFHTTRKVIVDFLEKPEVQEKLKGGNTIGPVTCKKVKAKTPGVPDYWLLVDAM